MARCGDLASVIKESTKRARARAGARLCALIVAPWLAAGCYSGLELGPKGAAAGDSAGSGSTGDGDGADSGGGDSQPPALCNGAPGVSPRPMMRLSPIEYENTMRDLLGDPDFVAEYDEFEPVISERAVRQLRNGAETALERSDHWTAPVYPCELGEAEEPGCVDGFLDDFAARAFRRPLTDSERQWLRGVYDEARATEDFAHAMAILTETVLQSPSLMYLHFEGEAVDGAPANIRRLTNHEVASRLSYFLWDTMPDAELLAAAGSGQLTTKEGLASHVDRMLEDPRSEAKVQQLVWDWVELDGGETHFALEDANKNPEHFPEYTPALQDAMRTELEALIEDAFETGTFSALLTSRRAYINRALADLYGVEGGPVDDDDWQWVELDPEQRSGLLTRAAFLTVYAGPNVQSPIRRGVSVLKDVLCFSVPPPPPDVDDTQPEGGDGEDGPMSIREAVEAQTAEAQCLACHSLINPAGFAFEHYDAVGRWQQQELLSGLPIDSSGKISVSDVDGPVADAVEMSQTLVGSEQVKSCFADFWFEQAVGGELGELDDCERERIVDAFSASGDMRALVRELVLSDTFRFINTGEE